jgi:hypothetical protein
MSWNVATGDRFVGRRAGATLVVMVRTPIETWPAARVAGPRSLPSQTLRKRGRTAAVVRRG